MGVTKMGNIVPRLEIEPTSLGFWSILLPLHHGAPCHHYYAAPCLRAQCRPLQLCLNPLDIDLHYSLHAIFEAFTTTIVSRIHLNIWTRNIHHVDICRCSLLCFQMALVTLKASLRSNGCESVSKTFHLWDILMHVECQWRRLPNLMHPSMHSHCRVFRDGCDPLIWF